MLELLKTNNGFTNPERWIEYGIDHKFEKMHSVKLTGCPDCNNITFKLIGQFVYYSTLISLKLCTQCGLFFTDTRIDPIVIRHHFEKEYKNDDYFINRRSLIFEQITGIVDSFSPIGGRILDVGGAKGHLLYSINKRRPDIQCVLNDISKAACDYAESNYGFQIILGGIDELEKISSKFELIILSDVMYYEPEIRRLWNVLSRLVGENGALIIRVPNKLHIIRIWQFLLRSIIKPFNYELVDNIKFFNPEHLFVFSRRYLTMRLKSIGFQRVYFTPSEILFHAKYNVFYRFFYFLSYVIWIISFGKIIFTPSLLIMAKKN